MEKKERKKYKAEARPRKSVHHSCNYQPLLYTHTEQREREGADSVHQSVVSRLSRNVGVCVYSLFVGPKGNKWRERE